MMKERMNYKTTTISILKTLCSVAVLTAFALGPAPAQANPDITTGLVAHWKLDETGSTTTVIDSMGGYDGTMSYGLTGANSTTGKIGTALQLDGTNDRITVPYNANINPAQITSCAWVKVNTPTGNYPSIAVTQVWPNKGYNFGFNDTTGDVIWSVFDGSPNLLSYSLNVKAWHHYCGTADGTTQNLYVDGVLAGTQTSGYVVNNSASTYIASTAAVSNTLDGVIDDVRIYNRVLTAEDVKELYQSTDGSIRFSNETDSIQYYNGREWVHAGTGSYAAYGAHFDGTNDYLQLSSSLSNVPACRSFSTSFWIKRNGGFGSFQMIWDTAGSNNYLQIDNANRIIFIGEGGIDVRSDPITDSNWHHVLLSVDNQTGESSVYIDGIESAASVTLNNTGNMDNNNSAHYIGQSNLGPPDLDADLADVWMEFCQYIDFSVATNREKFISATGTPMYLGPNCALPTGKSPDICLTGPIEDWHTNKGTGGGFTENGTIVYASSQPNKPDYDPLWQDVAMLLKFDNATSGTSTIDYSSAGNTVTSYNSAALSNGFAPGFGGTAVSDVNAGNRYWQVTGDLSEIDISQPHTLEYWVREINGLSYREQLCFVRNSPFTRAEIGWESGSGGHIYSPWGGWTGITQNTFTWYHYAFVFDGTDTTLYVNGVSQGTPNASANNLANFDGVVFDSMSLGIGCDGSGPSPGSGLNMQGWMDDFRYTKGVRYTSDFTPPDPPLPEGAYCTNPSEFIGSIIYNTDNKVMQYCNGRDWVAMGPVGGTGGPGCPTASGLANAGDMGYDKRYNVLEYCNAEDWVGIGHDNYFANAVTFDGTSDKLTIGSNVFPADSKRVSGSFWFRRNGNFGSNQVIYSNTNADFRIQFNASDNIRFVGNNSSHTNILNIASNAVITDSEWHHVAFNIDMANIANTYLYIDDASDTFSNNLYTDDLLGLASPANVGDNSAGTLKMNADLADFWLNSGTNIDLSVEANRRKFIDASGRPVDLGADGSQPTGSQPEVFLSGDTANWHTNKGTGGGFTENGALTDAPTTPN